LAFTASASFFSVILKGMLAKAPSHCYCLSTLEDIHMMGDQHTHKDNVRSVVERVGDLVHELLASSVNLIFGEIRHGGGNEYDSEIARRDGTKTQPSVVHGGERRGGAEPNTRGKCGDSR
jgi:hypothetical protein